MYEDAAKMFEWTSKIYPYYAIPHQIIFPTLAWIVAEVKTRTSKKNNAIKAEETDSTALPESHN